MIRYVENKNRIAELTSYQVITLADAVSKLVNEAKGKVIQCHYGRYLSDFFMEGRYSYVKVSGSELRFHDSREVNNRMVLPLKEVVKVEKGEDAKYNFITFRFDLKDNMFVTITPM